MAKNTIECPSCQYTWPATEAGLGLQSCPGCGIVLEVKRVAMHQMSRLSALVAGNRV